MAEIPSRKPLDELYTTLKAMKKAISTAERLSIQYRATTGDALPAVYIDYMNDIIQRTEGLVTRSKRQFYDD